MFSKAKRFVPVAAPKIQPNGVKKPETEVPKPKTKAPVAPPTSKVPPAPPSSVSSKPASCKAKQTPAATPVKNNVETQSQCSSVKSTKSFVTPKPIKAPIKAPSSLKKVLPLPAKEKKSQIPKKTQESDILKDQEVEIRNKDYTIAEYNKQIEELKTEIASLHKQMHEQMKKNEIGNIDNQLSKITLEDNDQNRNVDNSEVINKLQQNIADLEQQCARLEEEVTTKQMELRSLEELIVIRDSLCKDLQDKLTSMENNLEETKQRLEMVKGHHALALEANESIRREYKAELETVKSKFEDEKLIIITKSKADQEGLKLKYNSMIESIKNQLMSEKQEAVAELQLQLTTKDMEMKAKLEQIDEATHEKLRLCEIQFEERSRAIQEHWEQQQKQLQYLENETKDLKYSLNINEEHNEKLQKEIHLLKNEVETLRAEKNALVKETHDLKEEAKKKLIDFDNEINKLTLEVDKTTKEKNKFEMSLSVTRDIVDVLTMRLRESDNELEHLENKVQNLTDSKEVLENELATYKNTLGNTVLECNEYKEALVNILKSKAALAKEHNRIMEHNVTLIESLQNVEKEAYRELGSIKYELIEDVELLKKESKSQIQMLRDEVEQKRVLCEMAQEHAGQATAAADQARVLLAQAASEISRLEGENQRLQQQIQDQQSLVVELSLLRQENEELSMTVAKQSSIMDKMKKDAETAPLSLPHAGVKSPSLHRKTYKAGKENMQLVVSPLRERNH
ncbi:hypothetical protein NE865_05957 [Phthorimaea operculella]|nr:hypothetical protein NE865_05957 [Phthorimaea operculella]